MRFSLFTLACQLALPLFESYLASQIVAWVWLSCHTQKTQSYSRLPGLRALTILSLPLSLHFWHFRWRGGVIDVPVGVGYPVVGCSLPFDQR